jgi:hypothetical protein
MTSLYYIGFDIHKKMIAYRIKALGSGQVYAQPGVAVSWSALLATGRSRFIARTGVHGTLNSIVLATQFVSLTVMGTPFDTMS